MSDAKRNRRTGCIIAVVGSIVLWAAIYAAVRYFPYVPSGEGPWPENFR